MINKPLNQELFDEPYKFEFFQAVRLLERIFPERSAVTRSVTPLNEVVRFRSNASLRFPPSEIYDITETYDEFSDKTKLEMFVNFMGMLGIVGVLPVHYTELAIERARYGDTTMWSFLDIFSHRAVSMFFRAWEKYRFPVQYERGNDDFTAYLYDFLGLGTTGLRGRMNLDDEGLLPYGGLILQKPHSTSALEQILEDYFQVKAKIQQFSGQWLSLDEESITRLGKANSALGVTAIAGTRIWDYQSKFRVVLGSLKFIEFQAFLPNGTAYKPLLSIIRFMTGEELDFEVQLKLKAKEVPSTILTTRAKRRPMLGWTSFLKTKPFEQDDEQVIL
ncbi:MAG: type VI secretion system baseplate subunit TssG, partial [Acidobacteriota bacterium]|nr:type VI secretion system baseplate subunit TssG [Acidobacteriota bacterium]